ncbi:acyl-CoA carboxylase subunit epsilon [Streptomyces sp. cg2]|uniref:acyl-CoA carboxylase subunit epsilon n=1 Tax=Streptomyces sp. cg2 TaxID=3238799 RepID=UPI0034E24C57
MNPESPAEDGPIRVEKGAASEEELAALIAVLLDRSGRHPGEDRHASRSRTVAARWRRLERSRGFHGAQTWQS